LCFLQTEAGPCEGVNQQHCKGACQEKEPPLRYNNRVSAALQQLIAEANFLIVDKGRNLKEKSYILVERGIFYGLGYVPVSIKLNDFTEVKTHLTPYRSNRYIQQIIQDFKESFPDKIQLLPPVPFSIH
ncbi:MAG: DNA polymerase III subunit epsilon, partial [Chitinophagaceae bacterium]